MINPFLNPQRQLRNGWWILIFFLVLASFLIPTLIIAQENTLEVPIGLQAMLIVLTSFICQWLRRKPLSELLGKLDGSWAKEFLWGGLIGFALMLIPALMLWIFGWVDWQLIPTSFSTLTTKLLLFASVAVAEELLFRGFIFQRLLAGLGQWPAQLLLAGYFLLTHLDNPGMTRGINVLASANIFIASLIFGLAFLRTKSLAMPLGLHFMANMMQGGVLGFGVSGTEQIGLFHPIFRGVPDWLTGGPFGLEGSVPGLVCVVVVFILLYTWNGTRESSPLDKY